MEWSSYAGESEIDSPINLQYCLRYISSRNHTTSYHRHVEESLSNYSLFSDYLNFNSFPFIP